MRALITGIRGQDGTYLAKELLAHDREVMGFTRMGGDAPERDGLFPVDYGDDRLLCERLEAIRPDEIYHLASPSCIRDSREYDQDIFAISVGTTLNLLRWITDHSPSTRFFFAGSAEIYGDPVVSPQNESTPCHPENPYAVAKLAGQNLCRVFRETKDVFASCGILFNHESPLRRPDFVTRRITMGVAAIASGKTEELALGNLEARRDWSHAADFARGFRMAMEARAPGDFVFASGESYAVRDFCELAFSAAGLQARDHLREDPAWYRPDFNHPRLGDAKRAGEVLGWKPERSFRELVEEMSRHDLKLAGL